MFKTLINNKTNVLATICSNRNNMPNDFCKIKLKKDECRIKSCNGILALKWKDLTKRDVYILSSKHETAEMSEKKNKNQFNYTLKLKCVIEYNKEMIEIDQ